ncbi:hypothetical protein M3Y96_00058000 [Aphelenchoides besseyi]|nr:hypothetical protein M3Y96_00058000 [Aphelenchoides besseyi]
MSHVDITATLEYLKNLPTRNSKVFTTVNRERLPQKSDTVDFMRIIDVEVRDDEKTFRNDKTPLLLYHMRQNYGNRTTGQEHSISKMSFEDNQTEPASTSTDSRLGVRRSSNQSTSAANVQPPKKRRGV